MCTVSVITIEGGAGFRLVTNRDESPERARELAPRWHEVSEAGVRAVWPIDGLMGGTWVAGAESGIALALLNGNLPAPAPTPDPGRRLSRGGIIPRLIGEASVDAVLRGLGSLELARFDAFRLVAVGAPGGVRIVETLWDGRDLSSVELGAGPACFASSGLGDRLVQGRLPLFERMVVAPGCSAEAQDDFHEHRWPDHPELSVMMERPGARTVSVTRVEIRPRGNRGYSVGMSHEPVGAPSGAGARGV
jgi:hypothetical protein